MCKEINCDCVSNYANTLSFTGTDGIRYTRTFSCNEIDELADNIDVIGNNMCVVESLGSTIYDDNIDKDSLIKIIKTMNEYIKNYCGNDFFCLIDINEHEEINMKKVYECYSNILLINQGLLNMFSQIEIKHLTDMISDIQNESMDIDSYGYIPPQYAEMNESSHEELESLLIDSFRNEIRESYEEE